MVPGTRTLANVLMGNNFHPLFHALKVHLDQDLWSFDTKSLIHCHVPQTVPEWFLLSGQAH